MYSLNSHIFTANIQFNHFKFIWFYIELKTTPFSPSFLIKQLGMGTFYFSHNLIDKFFNDENKTKKQPSLTTKYSKYKLLTIQNIRCRFFQRLFVHKNPETEAHRSDKTERESMHVTSLGFCL